MKYSLPLFAVMLVGAVSGCGSSKDAAKATPLTPAQKAQFNDTLNSTRRMTSAPTSAQTSSALADVVSVYSISFSNNLPTNATSMPDSIISTLSFNVMADVTDADFKSLNDVTHFEFRDDQKFEANHSGTHASGSVAGFIVSQKDGKLPVADVVSLSASKDQKGGKGEEVCTVTYPDHTAALKDLISIDENGTQTDSYYLNDESISKDAYDAYRADLGFSPVQK